MKSVWRGDPLILTHSRRRSDRGYCYFTVIVVVLAALLFSTGCRKSGSRKKEIQERYRNIQRDRTGFVHMERRVLEVLNPEQPTHYERAVRIRPLTRRTEIEKKMNPQLPASGIYYFASASEGRLWVNALHQQRICLFNADFTLRAIFPVDEALQPHPLNSDHLSEIAGAENGDLWISDSFNNRLLRLHPDGSLSRSFTFSHLDHSFFSFKPVFASDRGLPILNRTQNALEVCLPAVGGSAGYGPGYTLLDENTLKRSLPTDRIGEDAEFWMTPSADNIAYDINHRGELWVYCANESVAFFFKNRQQIRRFTIWPEWALADYLKSCRLPKSIIRLFTSFIMNSDQRRVFYLSGANSFPGYPENLTFIYCFDMDGQLLEIYTCMTQGSLEYQGNGLFYFSALNSVEVFSLP